MSYDLPGPSTDTLDPATMEVGDLYRTRRAGDELRLMKKTAIGVDGGWVLEGTGLTGRVRSTISLGPCDVVFRPAPARRQEQGPC